jgi:hypothetical protein
MSTPAEEWAKIPGIRIYGATAPTGLNATNAAHGSAEQNDKRKALNNLSAAPAFDGVVDFDKATLDAATGELKPEFVPDSTTGGPGDKLHPNRAGYLAMGNADRSRHGDGQEEEHAGEPVARFHSFPLVPAKAGTQTCPR